MQIKFNNIEDDFVAFNVFYSRHSPYARRIRILLGLLLPGILLIIVLSQAIYSRDWGWAILAIVLCGGLSVWILAGKNRQISSIASKIFREGKNRAFLGLHELETNDYGLSARSEYGESKIMWSGIERIGSTPDYTFIFVNATSAIILPKYRILEGDYDTFVVDLTTRFAEFSATTSKEHGIKQETAIVDPRPAFCEDKRAGRHSGFGIVSFLTAITIVSVDFLTFMAVVIMAIIDEEMAGSKEFATVICGVLFVISWVVSFIGAGLGLTGLLSKNRKKLFAIIGLILNLFLLFGFMLLIALR